MGLCIKGLMEDLGAGVQVQVNTDSSAAKSMTARRQDVHDTLKYESCWCRIVLQNESSIS